MNLPRVSLLVLRSLPTDWEKALSLFFEILCFLFSEVLQKSLDRLEVVLPSFLWTMIIKLNASEQNKRR